MAGLEERRIQGGGGGGCENNVQCGKEDTSEGGGQCGKEDTSGGGSKSVPQNVLTRMKKTEKDNRDLRAQISFLRKKNKDPRKTENPPNS